jgi:hypothetical protein
MNEDYMGQKHLEMQQTQIDQAQTQQDLQAMQIRDAEKNLIKEQLSLEEELQIIEHLLRGHVYSTKINDWIEPQDKEMIILTEHGVHLIMNTIMFYLNKNTLLSNYEEELINRKMEDFATALADVVFMEYEKVFLYPTFEECKAKLEDRINKKVELRKFAYDLVGKKADEEKIKHEFIEEIELTIEKEIEKIREQIIKNKLKRFEILIREIQDAVHSTYLRALYGAERRTLRQHIHISETTGGNLMPQPAGIRKNPLKWWKK